MTCCNGCRPKALATSPPLRVPRAGVYGGAGAGAPHPPPERLLPPACIRARPTRPAFLICTDCGAVAEAPFDAIRAGLDAAAGGIGFSIQRASIEAREPALPAPFRQGGGMSLLSMTHACVRFGGAEVLHDISLQIRAGEIVTIVGPNGSGKSTLLRALLGIVPVASGSVTRATGCASAMCRSA